jgi:glycerol-3-phosphate dehydrogenase
MTKLDSRNRQSIINNLNSHRFDLLVIGGGITGAGIALDAAARGLKVALVEKNDFAFGTSSRSTKLIHGGLRYLKQLEFGLVKEVGSERAVVHKLAPHLVVPEKMLLPLYEKRGFSSLLTSIGLKLYDFLAGVKSEDQRRMLTKKQTLKQEPLLLADDVKGGAIYAEYRTDDARLTTEIMKTASRHGAEVINYCEVVDFVYEARKIVGAKVKDVLTDTPYQIKATTVVSAAGPWVDELRTINHSKKGKQLHLTKGVHLVVDKKRLPITQAIYFDVEDGRMIFAIPRGRVTYIGTTDTNYMGSKEMVVATLEDAEYLIRAVNRTFPSAQLKLNDIESSWAGLRPLIHEEGKSASELSRKDEIFESSTGLISIAGGKLTGYRKMAERVVDLVLDKMNEADREFDECKTDLIPLAESPFKDYEEVKAYLTSVKERVSKLDLDSFYADYLVGNYGKQTNAILDDIQAGQIEIELAKAELRFGIANELITLPEDFFIRRTGRLYFFKNSIDVIEEAILHEFQVTFKWKELDLEKARQQLAMEVRSVTDFK